MISNASSFSEIQLQWLLNQNSWCITERSEERANNMTQMNANANCKYWRVQCKYHFHTQLASFISERLKQTLNSISKCLLPVQNMNNRKKRLDVDSSMFFCTDFYWHFPSAAINRCINQGTNIIYTSVRCELPRKCIWYNNAHTLEHISLLTLIDHDLLSKLWNMNVDCGHTDHPYSMLRTINSTVPVHFNAKRFHFNLMIFFSGQLSHDYLERITSSVAGVMSKILFFFIISRDRKNNTHYDVTWYNQISFGVRSFYFP